MGPMRIKCPRGCDCYITRTSPHTDSAFRCRHCNLILTPRDVNEILQEAPWLAEAAPSKGPIHWTENVTAFHREVEEVEPMEATRRMPKVGRETIPPTIDSTDVLTALMIAEAMTYENSELGVDDLLTTKWATAAIR